MPDQLPTELARHAKECTECQACVRQCAFLERHGTPRAIADRGAGQSLDFAFDCSLCRLCDRVCPEKLAPSAMFLAMRRQLVTSGGGEFAAHRPILFFERQGSSPLFSLYRLPPNCDTVFFPGCGLPATRSATVPPLFDLLAARFPNLGIVLDCCGKPSHDLGRTRSFQERFDELRATLRNCGITKVVVACPNCYRIFREYGEEFETIFLYDCLPPLPSLQNGRTVTVHDPCGTRFDTDIHRRVREIVTSLGLTVREMKHCGSRTLCCGEGGSACFTAPVLADTWRNKRLQQAGDLTMVTYCAGCLSFFSPHHPTVHLADLYLDGDRALAGAVKPARPPFSYLHRLLLKVRLGRRVAAKFAGARGRVQRRSP
ncbi:MAG: (Fe-S)-binding protein [Thermodesulfobacteriota bacterium]